MDHRRSVAGVAGWAWVLLAWLSLLVSLPAAAKDGVAELKGAVQAMPASGFVGSWTIAGRSAHADATTVVKQELGRIGIGALVEAKANIAVDGSLLLTVVEVKQGVGGSGVPAPPPGAGVVDDETVGAIEALPAGSLLGVWRVAGLSITVVGSTVLDQELGGFAVGTIVEVHAVPAAGGALVASRIEVKAGGTATPQPAQGTVELLGAVEAVPATGSAGNWRIAGRTVVVNAVTVLDAEHGPLVVGAQVEVKGSNDSAGTLVATKIERVAGNGAPVPPLKFWGVVESLPATPGFVGLWKVGGRFVNVMASTGLHVDDGPFVVGAVVEVNGWTQPDGVVEAHEVETRSAIGALAGQGTEAVEFFNAQLGQFFMTAFPSEIAVLDGGAFGGAWKRTGQSFKVGGGSAAACRFYAPPPQGAGAHFFTVDPVECAAVMQRFSAWEFEAHAFSITPAVSGSCAAGLLPVNRFYNNASASVGVNHRYTVTAAAFADSVARGWTDEGVVMCAAP